MARDGHVRAELLHRRADRAASAPTAWPAAASPSSRPARLIALSGITIWHFWTALVLLGVGWNFAFVGATAHGDACHRPNERNKVQAVNDFLVFGSMAIGSFSSGDLLASFGWSMVARWCCRWSWWRARCSWVSTWRRVRKRRDSPLLRGRRRRRPRWPCLTRRAPGTGPAGRAGGRGKTDGITKSMARRRCVAAAFLAMSAPDCGGTATSLAVLRPGGAQSPAFPG